MPTPVVSYECYDCGKTYSDEHEAEKCELSHESDEVEEELELKETFNKAKEVFLTSIGPLLKRGEELKKKEFLIKPEFLPFNFRLVLGEFNGLVFTGVTKVTERKSLTPEQRAVRDFSNTLVCHKNFRIYAEKELDAFDAGSAKTECVIDIFKVYNAEGIAEFLAARDELEKITDKIIEFEQEYWDCYKFVENYEFYSTNFFKTLEFEDVYF